MDNETTSESRPQEELSIGSLLKTEREKRGISKKRLSEVIKVREQFIDALEKEEWDKLPARVFIKGFIRSYTISIGYNTKEALRLFDKSFPSRGEDTLAPLAARRMKNRTMYYAVPILIILAWAVYLFTEKDKVENNIEPVQAVSETHSTEIVQGPGVPGQAGLAETAMPNEGMDTTPANPEKEVMGQEKPKQAAEKKTEKKVEDHTPAGETLPRKTIVQENTYRAEEPRETAGEESSGPETVPAESHTPLITVSATVIERTYVKIIIDDNPPKEYIFQPGTYPDWTAERGFEITVGNAAGIKFEFNGERYEDLGAEGKVKTLRFPKDFKTNWKEE